MKGAIGPFVVLEENELKNLTIHLTSIAPMEFYRGEQLHLPALEMLLSRGSSESIKTGGDSAIFSEIALENVTYAQQRLAGEEQLPADNDSGFWYCADPVYLKADRDQVLLSHPASVQIQDSEADALISAFNQLFREDGIQLWRPSTGKGRTERWYLRAEQTWQLTTTPLDKSEGRSIRELMPQGDDALRWSKVIAELEMLFFGHSVNQRRSERGEPLISSVWLWGEHKQSCPLHVEWDVLVGQHPLLKGLNRMRGTPLLEVTPSFDELIEYTGNGLMIIDGLSGLQRSGGYHDIAVLLQDLEQRLFAPALAALRQGRLKELRIQPANGSIYTIRRSNLMRFWRRAKPAWLNLGS